MIDDVILAGIPKNRAVARPAPTFFFFLIRLKDNLAIAIHHQAALLVEIGPHDLLRAAISGVIGAVRAFAAIIVGREKIPIALPLEDVVGLDGVEPAGRRRPCRNPHDLAVAGPRLAGLGIELDDLEPGPEAAEGQPLIALAVDDMGGIDAIVAIRCQRFCKPDRDLPICNWETWDPAWHLSPARLPIGWSRNSKPRSRDSICRWQR